jgi:hypothetical protein
VLNGLIGRNESRFKREPDGVDVGLPEPSPKGGGPKLG